MYYVLSIMYYVLCIKYYVLCIIIYSINFMFKYKYIIKIDFNFDYVLNK